MNGGNSYPQTALRVSQARSFFILFCFGHISGHSNLSLNALNTHLNNRAQLLLNSRMSSTYRKNQRWLTVTMISLALYREATGLVWIVRKGLPWTDNCKNIKCLLRHPIARTHTLYEVSCQTIFSKAFILTFPQSSSLQAESQQGKAPRIRLPIRYLFWVPRGRHSLRERNIDHSTPLGNAATGGNSVARDCHLTWNRWICGSFDIVRPRAFFEDGRYLQPRYFRAST